MRREGDYKGGKGRYGGERDGVWEKGMVRGRKGWYEGKDGMPTGGETLERKSVEGDGREDFEGGVLEGIIEYWKGLREDF